MVEVTQSARDAADADSGMSGPDVERAGFLWANLPTGRKWTSLATHEKALVCHAVAAAEQRGAERQIELDALIAEKDADSDWSDGIPRGLGIAEEIRKQTKG